MEPDETLQFATKLLEKGPKSSSFRVLWNISFVQYQACYGLTKFNAALLYSLHGYCKSNKKDLAKGKDCRDWNPLIAFGWCRQDLKDFNKLCQVLKTKSTFNDVEASKFISTFKHWYGFNIHFNDLNLCGAVNGNGDSIYVQWSNSYLISQRYHLKVFEGLHNFLRWHGRYFQKFYVFIRDRFEHILML